jgi:drug/metabolite transporter (DMT)-like permease
MNQTRLASLSLLAGGAFWGLYWLPLRQIEANGLNGDWVAAAVFVAALAVLFPFAIARRASLVARARDLAMTGLLTGGAVGLFTAALVHTDVVRAILLFYLTPIWSTALGVAVLGERLTTRRAITIALGLSGLIVVLGTGVTFPRPRNIGDWMALVSGFSWALASVKLYRMAPAPLPDLMITFITGCAFVTGVLLLISLPPFPATATASALPWVILTGLYLVPMLALTLWPATILSPTRVGLLLMTEIVVGVTSAAAFSGEPFGFSEALGCLLIVSAALSEVLAQPSRRQSG